MSITEQTVKCPVCGRPYKFYAFMAGDQSACPACVKAAESAVKAPDTPEQIRRRREAYPNA
jgi:endogenous inhibitor of DNA gyrase (YacG/DUF329 family)